MLLGKKIGMTQVYDAEGRMTSVTVLQAGPCKIMQVKAPQTDGYSALQLGYDDVKKSRVKKPAAGHAQKTESTAKRFVREWRLGGKEAAPFNAGDDVKVSIFQDVKYVDVAGTSKGKGYAGVMKRHGFAGLGASHGVHRVHRAPGSIGGCATPGRVFKGMRMAGRMGNDKVTTQNLTVHKVDAEAGLLLIKGAIPGRKGGIVVIRDAVKGGA